MRWRFIPQTSSVNSWARAPNGQFADFTPLVAEVVQNPDHGGQQSRATVHRSTSWRAAGRVLGRPVWRRRPEPLRQGYLCVRRRPRQWQADAQRARTYGPAGSWPAAETTHGRAWPVNLHPVLPAPAGVETRTREARHGPTCRDGNWRAVAPRSSTRIGAPVWPMQRCRSPVHRTRRKAMTHRWARGIPHSLRALSKSDDC